jgi:hypothetical protein
MLNGKMLCNPAFSQKERNIELNMAKEEIEKLLNLRFKRVSRLSFGSSHGVTAVIKIGNSLLMFYGSGYPYCLEE